MDGGADGWGQARLIEAGCGGEVAYAGEDDALGCFQWIGAVGYCDFGA
jgi:hypothetical protein